MTATKYRVHHAIDECFAEDQRAVDLTLRRMYRAAARAGLSPRQPHRVAVIRTGWGYLYELRWIVPGDGPVL